VNQISDYVNDLIQYIKLKSPENPDLPRYVMGHSLGALIVAATAVHCNWDAY